MKETILSELLLQRLERPADGATDKNGAHMNRQLYEIIRQEILAGSLVAGTKLPASRLLSKEVGVSRNTVLYAYEQLLAEGYVTAASGSGTFVSQSFPDHSALHNHRAQSGTMAVPAMQQNPNRFTLSRRGQHLISHSGASDRQWGAFVAGVPDVSLFPHAVWARLLNKHWRAPRPELLTYAHNGGYMPLRRVLAEHLRLVRSVRCEPEQIILTTGIHQAIDLIARLLGDVGDKAWMEDPGYWGTRSLLNSAGIETIPVPVDSEGLAPDAATLQNPPRFIFATPSHQYPLGMVMSLSRRRMLLEYARQRGAWIVEDDYDSEFRFEGRPLASLQGLDEHDRVIYMGTFSKTLFPGLRMGFMVLPKPLAPHFATGLSELFREGQLVQQAVLADFIEEGHYATHIRRMRQRYAQRQGLLRESIAARLGAAWPTSTHEAGLHMVIHLPPGADDLGISMAARTQGLSTRPLSRYFSDPAQATQQGLLLGYACVPEAEIAPAFNKLAEVIEPALEHLARTQAPRRAPAAAINREAWSGA
ncbi:MocR-like pyridoxine biosynthesis transcription factor PdxR [Cupriavidus basilensis]|uniref:MocR-like pyridoxine biosynthesis transcription factor PdxR n=1 Tax=Cupriavidus TaxID=106589 RepID=UPI00044FEB86|nr:MULTISPECIES: PLP-dependent aminotransferase family protein [Cupriavidus]KDP89183.1 DNA-binding protein [Cupriavidus sp. SK-3]MDF3881412.1 PLP-dependent aminotransferase family protein [Cupriavidus basilensis]